MLAIYKREMHAYFTTSVGYIFIAVALALSGFCFSITTLQGLGGTPTADTSTYFLIMIFALMIMLPILTMKSFSEERKTKTEQLLLTAPVSITSMVAAKFLAAYTMFVGTVLLSSFNYVTIYLYAEKSTIYGNMDPNAAAIVGNTIAMLLVGMCFIAIGLFISSLTENQFAAVVITIAVLLGLLFIGTFNNIINVYAIRYILSWLSIYSRYSNFANGFFDFGALFYYLSITVVFLFLTIRVYEKRRWN
ncbi:MAG: ABC transporter permease [Clostridia bacterium]|nr:ABC transporter permease [Clostridia bacterium]